MFKRKHNQKILTWGFYKHDNTSSPLPRPENLGDHTLGSHSDTYHGVLGIETPYFLGQLLGDSNPASVAPVISAVSVTVRKHDLLPGSQF